MGKKKLLFLHFDLSGGGAEKVLVNLVNGLNRDKYDITLMLLFKRGDNLKNLAPDVRLKYVFRTPFRGFTTLSKLCSPEYLHRRLIRERYDVEIAYIEYAPTRIIAGGADARTKRVAWIHLPDQPLQKIYRSTEEMRRCYARYDRVVCVSDETQQKFEASTQWHDLPYTVLPNVMDTRHILRCAEEEVGVAFSPSAVHLCVVGKLSKTKGVLRLAECLCQLYEEGITNWHIHFLGIGEEEQTLRQRFERAGLADRCTLWGYQSNVYKYVARMSLFVCPSYNEGYSTATIEAFVLGVPVLTTDCGGMRQITDKGRYALLVENSDEALKAGLRHLLTHPAELERYKHLAEERAAYFAPSVALAATEAMLDSL